MSLNIQDKKQALRASSDNHQDHPVARTLPSLKYNIGFAFLGNAAYAAGQWFTIALIARFYGSETLGHYAYANAIVVPFLQFASLKMRSVLANDVTNVFSVRQYLNVRCTSVVLIAMLLCVLVACGLFDVTWGLFLPILVMRSVEMMSDLYFGFLQRDEEIRTITVHQCCKTAFSVSAILLFALWKQPFLTSLTASVSLFVGYSAIVECAHFWTRYARSIRGNNASPPHKSTRALVSTALPLGITLASGALWQNMPRYFLMNSIGPGAVGIYSAIIAPLMAVSVVINSLGQTAGPRLARFWAAHDFDGFSALLSRLLKIGLFLGCGLIAAAIVGGSGGLQLLYGQGFASHSTVLIVSAVGIAALNVYIFLGSALNSMRLYWIQLPMHLVSLGGMCAFSTLLIPKYGLMGAAFALLAAYLFEASVYYTTFVAAFRSSRPKI